MYDGCCKDNFWYLHPFLNPKGMQVHTGRYASPESASQGPSRRPRWGHWKGKKSRTWLQWEAKRAKLAFLVEKPPVDKVHIEWFMASKNDMPAKLSNKVSAAV